jgi:hypothetical protein
MCSSAPMSTNPDRVVQTLSKWLAGHADSAQMERALAEPGELGPESSALVEELRREIAKPGLSRAKLQPLVRETIEAIAHGD